MSNTGNEYALSTGNDFPIRATITSEIGEDVTGLTVTTFFALTEGGEAITDPDTAVTLTEDIDSPTTARVYTGALDQAVVDDLVALGKAKLWLCIQREGDLQTWKAVPVIKYRRLA